MDTTLAPDELFGSGHMPMPDLEMALQLMGDALEGLDDGLNIGAA